jgi:hypothetical protein
MSDDDNKDKPINDGNYADEDNAYDTRIIHAEPLFDEKYSRNRGAPKETITTKDEAFTWAQKCFARIIVDGKLRILNEENPNNIFLMTKRDFIDAYEHLNILSLSDDNKPKVMPITELWLKHPLRRTYEGIIFDPFKTFDIADEYYNPWRGFAITPGIGVVDRYLDYMLNIVVSGNKEHHEWLLDWIAHIFQKPWEKPGTCVVLRGIEGIGKSFFAETIGQLIGGRKNNKTNHYYFKTSNPEHVMNHFNDHLANIILLHLEETFWAGDKKGAHLIKDFITGDELSIGQKHLSTKMQRSYMRLIMNGNDDWLVPAGMESRRFSVFDVSDELRQNTEFYKDMSDWLDKQNGFEALMYFFKHRDITHDVRKAPVTEGLIQQRIHNMDSLQSWWMNILIAGRLPYVDINVDGNVKVVKEVLFDNYCSAMRKSMTRTRSTETDFGNKMRSYVPKIERGKITKGGMGKPESLLVNCKVGSKGEQRIAFIIPPLDVCRKCMDHILGSKYEWETTVDGDGGWSKITDISDGVFM